MGAASKKRAVQGGCPNRFLAGGRGTIAGRINDAVTVACVLAADGVLRQLYASSASAFASVLQPLAAMSRSKKAP